MPTREEIDNLCDEYGLDDALLADGLDDAFVGFADRAGMRTSSLYDKTKCIEVFMKRDGMSEEEAEEYFEFNVVGAYVGETTPVFAVFTHR